MNNFHGAPGKTASSMETSLSVISVPVSLPSTSFPDQCSDLISEVLPPGGFTLVSLDLDQLRQQQLQTSLPQSEEERTDHVDDGFDEGVNLVVKGSWWCCKDCNVKQKLGVGESIEDHLLHKHGIGTKLEDTFDGDQAMDSLTEECRPGTSANEGAPCSEVVSSVLTLPSDIVPVDDGQGTETFIVIDGSTTVQVFTKKTSDNSVLSMPLAEEIKPVFAPQAKPVLAPQTSSDTISSSKQSIPENSRECVSAVKPLAQMEPIPVIFALPVTDTQSPSFVPLPDNISSQTEDREKEFQYPSSSSTDPADIMSSNIASTQSCSTANRENSTTNESASECCDGIINSNTQTDSDRHFDSERNMSKTISGVNAGNQIQTDTNSVCKKVHTDADSHPISDKIKTDSNSYLVRNETKACFSPDAGRTEMQPGINIDINVNRKQISNKSSGSMPNVQSGDATHDITRGNLSQKKGNNVGDVLLKDCSVCLTRLTVDEINAFHGKPARSMVKTRSKTASPVKCAKQIKDAHKPVLLKPSLIPKKDHLISPYVQSSNTTAKGTGSAHIHSTAAKMHPPINVNTRTLSGRKIRKPARYLSGSENEEEEEDNKQQPEQQLQHSFSVSNSKETPCLNNPSRYSRKRKRSQNADARELDTSNARDIPSNGCKKAKEENFLCQVCSRKFRSQSKLEKHSKLYAGHSMQCCAECGHRVHNQDLLNIHNYHVHLTKEPTSCPPCGKSLGSKRNLLSHVLTHPNMEGQSVANLIRDSCAVHECSICDEPIVIGEGRVERHYLSHEKPVTHACQKCGESFRHKKQLYTHLRTHGDFTETLLQGSGNDDMKEGCNNISEQDYKNKNNLDTSLDTDESDIADSVKQIMKFEESDSLNVEKSMPVTYFANMTENAKTEGQRSMNAKPSIYCELCKERFATKKLLYQHLKSHGTELSDQAVNEDGVEGELEAQPVDLSTGVPFGIPCSLVKVEIQDENDNFLRQSFASAGKGLVEPSQIRYSCALCEREFESEIIARRHIKRFRPHDDLLQCSLCSARFHNLDLFNVHYVYIHLPARSATCLGCRKDFNNKLDFITHLGNSPHSHPLSHKMGMATFMQDACGTVTCAVCLASVWNHPTNVASHARKHRNLSCPICRIEMRHKYALFIHLQIHANANRLGLESKLSERELQQNQQMETLHGIVSDIESSSFVERGDKFSCSFCQGEVMCTRKNIHQHLDLHARKLLHSIREGRYFCPECGEDLAVSEQSVTQLTDHLASHGHTQVTFACIFCSQTFTSFNVFKDHESKKHWLNVYFEKNMCDICGKEFVSRQQFKKHIKLHEEKQGLFSCSHCPQTFRFESKLQKHMAKHKKASYACQFCGKLYMTKISLHRHEQVVHVGVKDFKHKCKLCEAQFINATHLRDHVTNRHTAGASCYRCPHCARGFQYLSTFARHKRVVHGGDTPYVCQECGEKFPKKELLQRHTASHTGVDPFQCPACPKTFGLERTMREHYDFTHRGIQRFGCPHCLRKFPRKRSLKRHLETCRSLVQAQAQPVGVVEEEPKAVVYAGGKMPVDVAGAGVPVEVQAAAAVSHHAGLVVIQQL